MRCEALYRNLLVEGDLHALVSYRHVEVGTELLVPYQEQSEVLVHVDDHGSAAHVVALGDDDLPGPRDRLLQNWVQPRRDGLVDVLHVAEHEPLAALHSFDHLREQPVEAAFGDVSVLLHSLVAVHEHLLQKIEFLDHFALLLLQLLGDCAAVYGPGHLHDPPDDSYYLFLAVFPLSAFFALDDEAAGETLAALQKREHYLRRSLLAQFDCEGCKFVAEVVEFALDVGLFLAADEFVGVGLAAQRQGAELLAVGSGQKSHKFLLAAAAAPRDEEAVAQGQDLL